MSYSVNKYLLGKPYSINSAQVYVQLYASKSIQNAEAALQFLRDNCPSPLLQKRVSPVGLTVVLEASHNPRIVFGRSPPTGNEQKDTREILSIIPANGLTAKCIG